ncbi:MAG: hypothetical protein GX920_04475 [Micrococcus sp.]|nr:hypothetical protein [Micrococcus sp.]
MNKLAELEIDADMLPLFSGSVDCATGTCIVAATVEREEQMLDEPAHELALTI